VSLFLQWERGLLLTYLFAHSNGCASNFGRTV